MFNKRFIATIFTFIMLISIGNAFAAELPNPDTVIIIESIAELNNHKIMVGDENGDFRGESNITRGEFATIICRILAHENSAKQLQFMPSQFSDTESHWANGYINMAYNIGIINGFEDASFRPDNNVTAAQAIKMLVCALGYGDNTVSYPEGYVMKGADIELYKNITTSTEEIMAAKDEFATRNFVAVLLNNAINIPLRVQTSWSAAGNNTYSVLDGRDGKEFRTLRTLNFAQSATPSDETVTSSTEEATQFTGIYVTPTGKRYHYLATCAGENAIETTLENAISQGKTPCKTCVE